MGTRDPRVDQYISNAQPFARPILTYLREAVHAGCPACEETLKWSMPAFMYKGILCSMAAFKAHMAFGFWRASAMKSVGARADEAMGQFGRITSLADVPGKRELVRMVKEAAALHDAGVKAPRVKTAGKLALKEPAYFTAALGKNKKAQKTYAAFSPSAKREYLEWILGAKGEDTRKRRLERAVA